MVGTLQRWCRSAGRWKTCGLAVALGTAPCTGLLRIAVLLRMAMLLLVPMLLSGCHWHAQAVPQGPVGGGPLVPLIENPMFVPVMEREFLWNQVVDTVDDYFRIEREERVRQVGAVLTEGRIDTFPMVGSTLLEPWRRDSTPGFEKLHATLQSIRRRAVVRVIPVQNGYRVEVVVLKELEDLDRPEHGTVGQTASRQDATLQRRDAVVPVAEPVTLGWIPQGRDTSLEQQILAELGGRLADPVPAVAAGPGRRERAIR